MQCHFCQHELTSYKGQKLKPSSTFYHCPICGEIRLTEEAAEDFQGEQFSDFQKKYSVLFYEMNMRDEIKNLLRLLRHWMTCTDTYENIDL